jgi:hypothetical protein
MTPRLPVVTAPLHWNHNAFAAFSWVSGLDQAGIAETGRNPPIAAR